MTWKSRLALPECNRAGCGVPKMDGASYCEPHLDDQRMRTQRSTWRKRHSGVWRQEPITVMQWIGGVFVAVAIGLRR